MKFLEKMFSIRSNKQTYTDFSNEDGITFNSLTESIRNYSQLLSNSQIVEGKTGSHYYFNIEDDSNVIKLLGDEPLGEPINVGGFWDCSPKSLGLEIKINSTLERLYMEKDNEESVIKSILYKPFIKCIEKCIISGTYFDKPLFSTTNTITGTKDFDGLLKLVRRIKEKTDNGCIVGNSTTISEIVDTITNQSYLTEYLLQKTVEGVPVISTVDSPESINGKFLVGFDKTKICLLLVPEFSIRKFGVVGDISSRFHIYSFVNGGDVFNTSIGLTE